MKKALVLVVLLGCAPVDSAPAPDTCAMPVTDLDCTIENCPCDASFELPMGDFVLRTPEGPWSWRVKIPTKAEFEYTGDVGFGADVGPAGFAPPSACGKTYSGTCGAGRAEIDTYVDFSSSKSTLVRFVVYEGDFRGVTCCEE